jgi:hypothetical protein
MFSYNTNNPNVLQNTLKIISYQHKNADKNIQSHLVDKMFNIFEDKIKIVFDNNEKHTLYIKNILLNILDKNPNWNISNVNMWLIYYITYIHSKNYNTMINVITTTNTTNDMVFHDYLSFNNSYMVGLKMIMSIIDNFELNTFLRISFAFIMFSYIISINLFNSSLINLSFHLSK